jgi:hypothetical protein
MLHWQDISLVCMYRVALCLVGAPVQFYYILFLKRKKTIQSIIHLLLVRLQPWFVTQDNEWSLLFPV